jgi:phage anti-repressor protein
MIQLRSFLKNHATMPDSFIDNFLNMYNPDTIQTDFVVNLDSAAKWLKTRKSDLHETLKQSYKIDLDYIVQKLPSKHGNNGSNNYKIIMITPDCFKRLCMRSKTKRAEQVRTYFIELESLLVRYKSALLEGIRAEERRLQKSLRPNVVADRAGYIYVIRVAAGDMDNVYKIGRTKDLLSRLRTYNTGTLDGVDVVFKFRTDSYMKTEQCLKIMMKDHQLRKYKEVYQINLDIIKQLIAKCDKTAEYVRTYSKPSKLTGGFYVVLDEHN